MKEKILWAAEDWKRRSRGFISISMYKSKKECKRWEVGNPVKIIVIEAK